jgi:decaprenylphospho-beta-D-ribofuranose 2-oxidase
MDTTISDLPRGSRAPSATLTGTLTGWGRFPAVPGIVNLSEHLEHVTRDVPLTRGLGRAYGDAALPAGGDLRVAGSARADRILAFDVATGDLTAEAGLTLQDLYRIFLPRGFFTPVSPGTRFVTLGGMVACDVHGKNHHCAGTFGRHVRFLKIRVADGSIVTCSTSQNAELFWATIGGMGLTGHVLEVTARLARVPSAWIVSETERIPDIGAFMEALKAAGRKWPMTAGWIDCLSRGPALGRGILFRGRWAEAHEAPKGFPHLGSPTSVLFTMPDCVLDPLVVKGFNTLNYWTHGSRMKRRVVHPRKFFYPLDAIGGWNLLYGRRGFAQYQCVLPETAGHGAARRFLNLLTARGGASFLCVIKDCGAEGAGLLSFPKPGISIALDIPMRAGTQSLVDALNELVIRERGRIYLAKDALTRPEHFRAMEPRLDRFLRIRRRWDPQGRIRSAQSVRLFGW